MGKRAQFHAPVIAWAWIAKRASHDCHRGAMKADDHHEGAKTQHDLLQCEIGQSSPASCPACSISAKRDAPYRLRLMVCCAFWSIGSSLSPGG